MDDLTLLLLLSFLIWICIYVLRSNSGRCRGGARARLPPGPYGLPIIGNIFQLGENFHESLANLSQTYGPLMSLKLGSQITIVASSPEIVKDVLQKYDSAFSSRKVPDAIEAFDHHKVSVVWLPAANQWRNLRKIFREQLFSMQRLNSSQGLREEKVKELCDYVHQCCLGCQAVNIGEVAFTTSLNFVSSTLFSTDFGHYGSDSSQEIKESICSVMKSVGAPNLADFFPVLKVFDPQGLRQQAKFHLGKLLEIFDGIINQRLEERRTSLTSLRRKDFLEILLDLNEQNETEWSIKVIKHLFLDLIIAGTDTTSVAVEWAMAELLRNPEKLAKARAELREVIGKKKMFQESDISRLPYLQAVVKETFRLHPPGTILVRKAESNVQINEYTVPKNAQLLINIWAIGRDPSIWLNDPNSFVPERFLGSEIDVKGQHFELLAFGTGRRICLGLPLAHRMVHLMLASLLHNFDWKLEDENMDMTEKFGFTVHKALPVMAIPVVTSSIY